METVLCNIENENANGGAQRQEQARHNLKQIEKPVVINNTSEKRTAVPSDQEHNFPRIVISLVIVISRVTQERTETGHQHIQHPPPHQPPQSRHVRAPSNPTLQGTAYFASLDFWQSCRSDGTVARVLPAVAIPDVGDVVSAESAAAVLNETAQAVPCSSRRERCLRNCTGAEKQSEKRAGDLLRRMRRGSDMV